MNMVLQGSLPGLHCLRVFSSVLLQPATLLSCRAASGRRCEEGVRSHGAVFFLTIWKELDLVQSAGGDRGRGRSTVTAEDFCIQPIFSQLLKY